MKFSSLFFWKKTGRREDKRQDSIGETAYVVSGLHQSDGGEVSLSGSIVKARIADHLDIPSLDAGTEVTVVGNEGAYVLVAPSGRNGFTLVELSVVLVIMGLIVGAVFAGSDLIQASKLRNVLSEYEQYRTAANAFKLKYGYLPGDIPQAQARAFDLAPSSRPGTATNVLHGNGILENDLPLAMNGDANNFYSSRYPSVAFELGLFWRDLSSASLIGSSQLDQATDSDYYGWNFTTVATEINVNLLHIVPASKYKGGHWLVFGLNRGGKLYSIPYPSANYLMITKVTGTFTQYNTTTYDPLFTPGQAYNIDQKIDDGRALEGIVRGNDRTMGDTYIPVALYTSTCNDTGNSGSYRLGKPYVNTLACSLVFRM